MAPKGVGSLLREGSFLFLCSNSEPEVGADITDSFLAQLVGLHTWGFRPLGLQPLSRVGSRAELHNLDSQSSRWGKEGERFIPGASASAHPSANVNGSLDLS